MLTILGQPRPLAQLQRSLHAHRLAHTFIFAGPQGVGKFKTAIALAKTNMCDNPRTQSNGDTLPSLAADFPLTLPCDVCESCRAVDNRSHPDLHIITKELIRYHDKTGKSKGTTIGIDIIRGEITGSNDQDHPVEAKIYKRPFRGNSKWFIIDEADLMQPPAQNALLKTLEEPPPHSYLVLITTSPQELLQTIRSRSQIIPFNQLPTQQVLHGLLAHNIPHEDAALLARLAHGSLGRAVRWAQDRDLIAEKIAAAAATAARKAAKNKDKEIDTPEDEEAAPDKDGLTPGGMIGWTHKLATALDALVAGRAHPSDLATLIQKLASEYATIELYHDPLTSKDRATRDGIALLLALTAEWFNDRLRNHTGTLILTPLPAQSAALDPDTLHDILTHLRTAESQIDQNIHTNLLLTTTLTAIEETLRAPLHS